MPISLKATVGGGGDPVNSIKEMYLDDILYTTTQGQKWLRTGWVDTNVSAYPDAKQTTIALDMSNSDISYSGTGSTSQLDSFSGGGLMESYFTISSDRTKAAIPCGTTSEDLNRYVFYTTTGGTTWVGATLTAETTHNYVTGAIGTTKALFVGFDIANPSSGDSRFIKTNTLFASPTASVQMTAANLRLVCFTGANFLMASSTGKLVRVPDATDSLTYLPNAPSTSIDILMSPSSGVVLYSDFSSGRTRIYRSVDEGASWSNVLDLNTPATHSKRVTGFYVDGSKIYCTVAGKVESNNNQTMDIYVSTDNGVTWVNIPYSFTWDGVTYNSATGWPQSIGPSSYAAGSTNYNALFKDTSTSFRLPLYFNDTKMCYLQSTDNGVSWVMLKPATRSVWSEFISKIGNGKLWYTAQLTNGNFAVVNDMQSPKTNPVYKFQGSTTFVGVPEVYAATGQVGTTSVGTATASGSKYVRVL